MNSMRTVDWFPRLFQVPHW